MTSAGIASANQVFACSAVTAINRIKIAHELLGRLCNSLRRFKKALGETEDDDFWRDVLRPIGRYSFDHLAAPIPLSEADQLAVKCQPTALRIRNLYPEFEEAWTNLCLLYMEVLSCADNPLLRAIEDVARGMDGTKAVLVKESRLVSRTEKHLEGSDALRGMPAISSTQLIDSTCYDHLLVIGAARWFPSHVFNAPRAPDITIIKFDWLTDRLERSGSLIGQTAGTGSSAETLTFEDRGSLDAEEVIPKIDWTHIDRQVPWATESDTLSEHVEARLALLEHDRAVFLDAGAGASFITVDPREDDPREKIKRIPADELRPGNYLLLRTSGGGDYIVSIADKILGGRAQQLRNLQRSWKQKLRELVKVSSPLETSVRLLDLGSTCADEANVRNWMSFRSIKTQNENDFRAIMQLVGLGPEFQKYWDAMSQIDSAHRRAGHYIRKLLLRRMAETSLSDLDAQGWIEFSLPDTDAGSLGAYRLVELSPEVKEVPVSRLGHLFVLGEDPDG